MCRVGSNANARLPKRDKPGGHSALECAQPDKKANSWHLVRPGKYQISLLSHQGRVLCGLHFRGLAGTDVHSLACRRSQGLTGTAAHSLPPRRSQQNAQGVSCYPSSIPDVFSVDSVSQHHKATDRVTSLSQSPPLGKGQLIPALRARVSKVSPSHLYLCDLKWLTSSFWTLAPFSK